MHSCEREVGKAPNCWSSEAQECDEANADKPYVCRGMLYARMYVRFRRVNAGSVEVVGVRCHWKAQWFATALLCSLLGTGLLLFEILSDLSYPSKFRARVCDAGT